MSSPRLSVEVVKRANNKVYVVPVATACNAACVFCATMSYSPPTKPAFGEVDDLVSSANLIAALGVDRFEITGGGEPSLHPHLDSLVRELRRNQPSSSIKLYTNGSRLGDYFKQVDDIYISRCALDPTENQKLMRMSGGSPDLWRTVKAIRATSSAGVRLSVPLVRGGVDSARRAVRFARQCASLVDGLVFRPLYPSTPNRDLLEPGLDISLLRTSLADAGLLEGYVEVDDWGCFRTQSIILGADGRFSSDWGMVEHYEVG